MKLSVSAYRAHSSAHKKILSSSYQSQLNYGSTAASSSSTPSTVLTMQSIDNKLLIKPKDFESINIKTCENILSPSSMSTKNHIPKEDEDDSSNPPSSDCKSPSQRAKPTQRWMKLRTTVQLSSAIQKKPPLKREDSFLKRFSTRQIPEAQETVEDTGSDGAYHDQEKGVKSRKRYLQKRRTVVNPDENFYFYWLMFLTFCILYNLWTLIVRQSFPELQMSLSAMWFTCDCVSDIAFLVDIAVQLRTGYLEQGLVVYDNKKLALHYMCSKQFLLDILALLPLDLLQIRLGPQPLLRFPRFLKVYRSVKFYYIVESRTVWPNLWRVVNLIHILLILAHWFGCFYFLLSEAEEFQGEWVYPYRPGDYATLSRKYLGSLYWSTLTLTTIGDLPTPETNVEASDSADGPLALPRRGIKTRLLRYSTSYGYVFTIVSYLIGVFIFATIVGQVGNVITNRNANRLEFERLLDGAKTYMRHHKVPGGMKRRVLRWYDYSWSRGRIQGGGDINTALGLLPDKLKTELALHVNLSVLKKVTIFQECQPEFLHDLVLKMKAYIFTPGDSICRKGEVAREMFIIADGILEVLSETGKVLTTMKAGDFFGEIGILNLDGLNKRTADVRSVGYSELFSLSREDVLAAMKDYPEAQDILQTLGRKRLMEVRGINKRRNRAMSNEDVHNQSQSINSGNKNLNDTSAVKIVEKLRTDMKGIKSVLKKSNKTEKCTDDVYEVQTLSVNNSSSNSSASSKKSFLRRMNHVKSRDLNCINDEGSDSIPSGPIGAGLPLLQRLRLLKEKQDREEREAKLNIIKSPTHTHIMSAVSPQESIKEETEIETADTKMQISGQEIRNYETNDIDEIKTNKLLNIASPNLISENKSCSTSALCPAANIISTIKRKSSAPIYSPKIPLKVSFKDKIFESNSKMEQKANVNTKIGSKFFNEVKEPIIPTISTKALEPSVKCLSVSKQDQLQEKNNKFKQVQNGDSTKLWKKLKLATIITSKSYPNLFSNTKKLETNILTKPRSDVSINAFDDHNEIKFYPPIEINSQKAISQNEAKTNFSTHIKSKTYRSVDDLSPEYNGLPFVKKLKILNERQKIEELETLIQTRSRSLDCTQTVNKSNKNSFEPLIRSHSDASTIHNTKAESGVYLSPLQTLQYLCSPLSPESNETKERKHLKFVLRKLNKDKLQNTTSEANQNSTTSDIKNLLHAPTVEGYFARHTKLVKSVTLNSTLPSPPLSANNLQKQQSENVFPFSSTDVLTNKNSTIKETKHNLVFKTNIPCLQNNTNDKAQVPSIDQEYLNEITLAIKNLIYIHMTEIHTKLQHRIAMLELEISKRDQIIKKLQKRIENLEDESPKFCSKCSAHRLIKSSLNNTRDSSDELLFMREDSVDTIFAVTSSLSNTKHNVELKDVKRKPNNSRYQRKTRIKSCSELTVPEIYSVNRLKRPRSFQEVMISDVRGNITNISKDVILDTDKSSASSVASNLAHSQESTDEDENRNDNEEDDYNDDFNDQDEIQQRELRCDDWEVRMLAAELYRRKSNSRRARAASDSFTSDLRETKTGHHVRYICDNKKKQKQNRESNEFIENADDDDDEINTYVVSRPRAASLDQFNSRLKNSNGVTKAISLDRQKDRL